MKRLYLLPLALAVLSPTAAAATVTSEAFLVDTAADLAVLCAAAPDDPHQKEALGFCFGYVTGAYHYHLKSTGGPEGKGFVCVPDPTPSRSEAVAAFLAWLGEHPEKQKEDAVDALFEWATVQYPCP